jgi:hypothetical protein
MNTCVRVFGGAALVIALAACSGTSGPVPQNDVESATAGFSEVGDTCAKLALVAANAQPSALANGVLGDANCFVYKIKNTSDARSIGSVFITLPCCNPDTFPILGRWALVRPITVTISLSGNGSAGCAVDTDDAATFNPGEANGQIEIAGCSLGPGQALDVRFQLANPGCGDTWDFPSFLEANDGISTRAAWATDQSVLMVGCLSGGVKK